MTDHVQVEVAIDAPNEHWSTKKKLIVLSGAFLVASLANVLMAVGAYVVCNQLFFAMSDNSNAIYVTPATYVLMAMLWYGAMTASRTFTQDKGFPNDIAIIDVAPLFLVFAATFLQIGLLIWIAVPIDASTMLAVIGALSIIPIAKVITDQARPHIRLRVPPRYPTKRH